MRMRFFGLFVLALCACTSTAFGQDIRPDDRYNGYPVKITWARTLPDLRACAAEEYYEPADLHFLKYVNYLRSAGTPRIQEYPECAWMLTRNSWRWVLRPPGTVVLVDARGRDLADAKCGNPRPVSFQILPPPAPPQVKPAPPPRITVRPEPAPPPQPQPPPPPAARTEEPVERGDLIEEVPPEPKTTRFGLTASATPKFDTAPISSLVDRIVGNKSSCVKGSAFDAGVAWGDPNRSFLRLTFMYANVADGSSTSVDCSECSVRTTYLAGPLGPVKEYGVRAEFVVPFRTSSWPVHPMLTFFGGASLWSGQVTETAYYPKVVVGGSAEAKKLFGSYFFGGAGAGIVRTFRGRWTLGLMAVGLDIPHGLEYGVVQFTAWLGRRSQ